MTEWCGFAESMKRNENLAAKKPRGGIPYTLYLAATVPTRIPITILELIHLGQ